MVSRARRFDGENTWFYFLWYGLGRFWIEGLRTDSLYLFDWTFMGEPIRVSQALSLLLALTAAVMLFWNIRIRKHAPSELLVNQVAARAAEAAAAASAAEAGEEAGTPPAEEAAASGEAPAEPAVLRPGGAEDQEMEETDDGSAH